MTQRIALTGEDGQELRVDRLPNGDIRLTIDHYQWGHRDILLRDFASASLRAFLASPRRAIEEGPEDEAGA